MSLFQCENCGCVENTALSMQGFKITPVRLFEICGIENLFGLMLCSACGPKAFEGKPSGEYGKWHNQFSRLYLPLGGVKTDKRGNLEHIETGSKDYKSFEVGS